MKINIIFFIAFLLLISCSKKDHHGKTVKIAYTQSYESKILAMVCNAVLNDMGYASSVHLTKHDSVYPMLSNKQLDVYLSTQLPLSHISRFKEHRDSLQTIGTSYCPITNGLVVPGYVSINAITQLNYNANKFDHCIYVNKRNKLLQHTTHGVRQKYNLDFDIIELTLSELDSIIDTCYSMKKWIVYACPKPNVFWKKHQHKYLYDVLKLFPKEHLNTVAHKDFKADYPIVHKFLSKFSLSEDRLETLMYEFSITPNDRHHDIIKAWYKTHAHMLQTFYPDEWRE
ncbi:hypothetical protein OAO55_03035 [Bacteroidales bacterium]|nr:hypothetical protein [Bacteroidales bacterium]